MLLLLACATSDSGDLGPTTTEGRTDGGLYAYELGFDPPPAVGAVTVTLVTEPGATVGITPWMPAHGHGVTDQSDVVEVDGVYTTTWTWPMAGDWEVQLAIAGAAGSDSGTVDVVVD